MKLQIKLIDHSINKQIAIEVAWITSLFIISLLGAYSTYDHAFSPHIGLPFPDTRGSIWVKFPSWIIVGAIFFPLVIIVYLVKATCYRFKRRLLNIILIIATLGFIGFLIYVKHMLSFVA